MASFRRLLAPQAAAAYLADWNPHEHEIHSLDFRQVLILDFVHQARKQQE